jgi:hypothetical protein
MTETGATVLSCHNCRDPVFLGMDDPMEKAYRCLSCGEVLCALCKLEDSCCGATWAPVVVRGDPETTNIE